MDTFWSDPHMVVAIYSIAAALFLTVIVQAEVISDRRPLAGDDGARLRAG